MEFILNPKNNRVKTLLFFTLVIVAGYLSTLWVNVGS